MGIRRNKLALSAVVLLALGVLFLILGQRLSIRSDIQYFLPQQLAGDEQSPAETYLLDSLTGGEAGNVLLLRFAGREPRHTARLSNELQAALHRSPLFDKAHNGRIALQPDTEDVYFRYRYLVNRSIDEDYFSAAHLRAALQARLDELQSGAGLILKDVLLRDPTHAYVEFLRQARHAGAPARHLGVWFNASRSHGLMLASIPAQGYQLKRQREALQVIDSFFASHEVSDYTVSGPGVFALAIRDKVEYILSRFSLAALALIILLILFAFRSVRALLVVFLPMGLAMLAAAAVIALGEGGIHGITLGFGITLLGVAIDYPVHVLSHARGGGHGGEVLRRIGPTLIIGVLTTALSYLAFWGTGIEGLDELALFTVVGLFVALAATLFLVPGLMPRRQQTLNGLRERLHGKRRELSPVLIGVALIAMVGFAGATLWSSVQWEDDLADLSPVPEQARITDKQLRDELRIPDISHLFVVHDTALQKVLRRTEALDAQLTDLQRAGIITHRRAVSTLLPSHAHQRRAKQYLPESRSLAARLDQAVQPLPFKASAFTGFIDDVTNTRELEPLSLEQVRGTRFAEAIATLLGQREGRWFSTVQLIGVDYAALQPWLADHADVARHYLSLRQVTGRLLDAYRQLSLERLALGMGLVVILLLVLLRRLALSLLISAQLFLTIALTVAVLALLGVQLMVFHLLALLLIIGISLDYSLFFARHMDGASRANTLYGILIAFTTTLIAFGVLMLTEIPVLVAVGQTVFTGVCISLLNSWLVVNKLRTALRIA